MGARICGICRLLCFCLFCVLLRFRRFSRRLPALSTFAAAATTVLSSVGGGALSGIIASAADRARAKDASDGLAPGMEERVAEEIGRVLAAGDAERRGAAG